MARLRCAPTTRFGRADTLARPRASILTSTLHTSRSRSSSGGNLSLCHHRCMSVCRRCDRVVHHHGLSRGQPTGGGRRSASHTPQNTQAPFDPRGSRLHHEPSPDTEPITHAAARTKTQRNLTATAPVQFPPFVFSFLFPPPARSPASRRLYLLGGVWHRPPPNSPPSLYSSALFL
jgi:hypothetical protein